MFKNKVFERFFTSIFILHLLAAVNVATGATFKKNIRYDYNEKQEVYLAEEPLPKIVKKLKTKGLSQKRVVKYLKNTLPQITLEFAKNKFDIEWIDNNLQKSHIKDWDLMYSSAYGIHPNPNGYPTVAVCYMGPEVGYGLFAMTHIKEGDIISEYTGKLVTNRGLYKNNPYIAAASVDGSFRKIDAQYFGNAARFAQHLISEDDLHSYGYKILGKPMSGNDVAVANAGLAPIGFKDMRTCLIATKDIKMFEQIGFYYDKEFGFEHNSPWIKELLLFDKMGEIIPREKYEILYTTVIIKDQIATKPGHNDIITTATLPKSFFDINNFLEKSNFYFNYIDNYVVIEQISLLSDIRIIIDIDLWKEKIAQPKNRISISAYFVTTDTDINRFINTLKQTLKLNKEHRIKILKAAKKIDLTRLIDYWIH